MNEATLIGAIEKIDILRHTKTDKAVRSIRLATTEPPRGDFKGTTTYHTVVLWNSHAMAAEEFQRGDVVKVVGRIAYRTWEDRDGQKRYQTEIVAKSFGRPDDGEAREVPADTPTTPQRFSDPDDSLPF